MAKRIPRPRSFNSVHRQSIRPSTLFKRLPIWVSQADISAWLKLSQIDAQALIDGCPRVCLIEGVPKISKYQLQTQPYADLIKVMRRYPSAPSIRRVIRAEIEKILSDPSHPQHHAFQKEFAKYRGAR